MQLTLTMVALIIILIIVGTIIGQLKKKEYF
jgi:hypothetical protein